ncbi:MAG: RNA-binding protein [Spirochaetia bacterium]|nr:RNA-binding protein [Spirochaetia bacterium]
MANLNLFKSFKNQIPATDRQNSEGAPAYAFTDEHALAQYAATGCFGATFYASADAQLARVLELAQVVDTEFLAKTAIYCRQAGYMKDTPALLCAVLSKREPSLMKLAFDDIIDNGRMLRNFVQIIRSGKAGRKSLGNAPKRAVQNWISKRSAEQLFGDSIGQSPSLRDVIRMVRPKPDSREREALYGYLIGKKVETALLPESIRSYEDFRAGRTTQVPHVSFQMLSNLNLSREDWRKIALAASWQTTRMNLNTFARHGVFEDAECVELIARKLRDPELIGRSHAMPYQMLVAFVNSDSHVPETIRSSLEVALEIATSNVPVMEAQTYVCPDVSGSMMSPVTGYRKTASVVRCVDVAALIAAAFIRGNPDACVLPFDDQIRAIRLNPRDTIMTNASQLAKLGGGGTNISLPLVRMNSIRAKASLVVIVSDNQSWVDSGKEGTRLMAEWATFRRRNPGARLVCLDIQPNGNTQAREREDILNVGGFSDQVFDVIRDFVQGRSHSEHWVGEIKRIALG